MREVALLGKPVTIQGKEIQAGDQAPNFKVVSEDLREVTLDDYKGKVKLISVIPSVDTGVCAQQTRRFNEEAGKIENVHILSISMDLPFAQQHYCAANGIEKVDTLSDHRYADFGEKYGILIDDLRILSRAIFVVDSNDIVTYVEYIEDNNSHPDYEGALEAVRKAE